VKLSFKSEYACLAMIDLARHYSGGGVCRIADISARMEIPKKFLEQILLILKRTGYVKSQKGPEGGYKLAKSPDQIKLAEIIRLMTGALAPVESVSKYFYEPTPIEKSAPLIAVFQDIRDYTAKKLENTTFADLIKE